MINRLRKVLACGATVAALIGMFAIPAQAGPAASGVEAAGFWSNKCEYGRACLQANTNTVMFWNLDGCGSHTVGMLAYAGKAHGNAFRVTYQDGRWDEVAQWSSRRLDGRNQTVSAFVYC